MRLIVVITKELAFLQVLGFFGFIGA